jgi:hypothetical protein
VGNNCFLAVQNFLSSRLLSKHLKIKVILSLVLNGCKIWSLTIAEEHKLRVSENRVIRIILDIGGMR